MYVRERRGFYVACTQNAKFQLKQNKKTSAREETKHKKFQPRCLVIKKTETTIQEKKPQKLKQKQTKPKKSNQTKAMQKNPNNKNYNNKPPKPTITTSKPVKNTRQLQCQSDTTILLVPHM